MNYTYKQLWLINYPVMMSVLMEQLINITDAIFLGHVGETELGASAIAGVYYLAMYMLGFGFSLGLQVVIARRNGEQRYQETGKTFFQGLYFLGILGITLFILSHWISPFIISHLLTSDEVYSAVMKYLDWRSFGLFFIFPALAFRSFFVGIVRTKVLTVNALVMVLSNIILNYFLIFGIVNFSGWGIAGAAIASTLSELISLVMFILYAVLRMDKTHYGFNVFDRKIQIHLFKLSVWSMIHAFISVAPWFIFFIAIEHLGKTQLAIANIIRSISTFFFVIVNSFASTTGSLVSNLLGADEKEKVIPLCGKVIRLSYGIGIPLIVLALLFHNTVLGIYTDNQRLIQGAFGPFMVMLLNYLPAVPGYVYCNAVTGTGNTKLAFKFQIITIVIYCLYMTIITSFPDVSLTVYWTAEYLYVSVLLFLSWNYMRKKRWEIKAA